MAKQLAPLLKPQAPARSSGGGGGDAPIGPERDALNMPILPVTGFFRRMGAMTFDFLLLYTVQRVLAGMLKEPILANPQASWFIAGVLGFAYFALGDGPVGKGRTVGKLLVGIRVTTLDGGVPTLLQAVIRTAMLYPAIVISRGVNSWAFDSSTFFGSQMSLILTVYLLGALFVANVFAIIFNPFKMGLHDYVAKTLVRPSALESEPFAALRERVGKDWRRHYLQPQLMGAGTLLIVFGYLLFTQWPSQLDAPRQQKFQVERELVTEAGFPQSTIFQVSMFIPTTDDAADSEAEREAFFRRISGEDPPGPLRYRLRLANEGNWTADPEATEAMCRRYAELYLHRVFGAFEGPDLGYNWQDVSTTAMRQSSFTLRVELVEYFDLFLGGQEFPVATHEFPFEPLELKSEE